MTKLKLALFDATTQLKSDTPRLDAEILLCFSLKKPRSFIFSHPEYELSVEEEAYFQSLIKKRLQGTPIAYLVHQREFWSMPLKVNSHTLIPRPETELLIERVLNQCSKTSPLRVLDLGTGTGAIALALKKERPLWTVHACDKSLDALLVAKENAETLGLSVHFCHSDWFSAYPNMQFDLIVSNPPYIAENDPHLTEGDVQFEPRYALVSGTEGLDDIYTLIKDARDHLNSPGMFYLEHGYTQKEKIQALFAHFGYNDIKTHQDLQHLDRITQATFIANHV